MLRNQFILSWKVCLVLQFNIVFIWMSEKTATVIQYGSQYSNIRHNTSEKLCEKNIYKKFTIETMKGPAICWPKRLPTRCGEYVEKCIYSTYFADMGSDTTSSPTPSTSTTNDKSYFLIVFDVKFTFTLISL